MRNLSFAIVAVFLTACGFQKPGQNLGPESDTLNQCSGTEYRYESGTCWLYENRWAPQIGTGVCEWNRASVATPANCGITPQPQPNCSGTDYRWENGACWIYENRWAPQIPSCEWNRVTTTSPQSCGIDPNPPRPTPTPLPPRPTPTPRPHCDGTDYRIENGSCIRYENSYDQFSNSCRWERFGTTSDSNCGIVRPSCNATDYRVENGSCIRYEQEYDRSSNSCRWDRFGSVSDSNCGIVRPTCQGSDYRWESGSCNRYEQEYDRSSNSCRWDYSGTVGDSLCGVFPPPRPTPRPTPWPTPWPEPDPQPWPEPDPQPWPTPRPRPRPNPTPQPGPIGQMVDVYVNTASLVKGLPAQSSTLPESDKCRVSVGTRFRGRILRFAEGNHVKFAVTSGLRNCATLLENRNGSIFIFTPHVTIE